MKNYFAGAKTYEEVKKLFAKLAFELHPDHGGNAKEFQAMMEQYKKKIKTASHETMAEKKEKESKRYNSAEKDAEEYVAVLNELFNLNAEDIHIDLCGTWLWIDGNTKAHVKEFKEISARLKEKKMPGLFFSGKKKMWYWRPSTFSRRFNRRNYTFAEIANKYGVKRLVRKTTLFPTVKEDAV